MYCVTSHPVASFVAPGPRRRDVDLRGVEAGVMCWRGGMTVAHQERPFDIFTAHTMVFLHTHSPLACASGCSACGDMTIFLPCGDQVICSRTQTSGRRRGHDDGETIVSPDDLNPKY